MSLPTSCRKCGRVGKALCDRCTPPRVYGPHNKQYDDPEYKRNRQTMIDIAWQRQMPCWRCGKPFANKKAITCGHLIPLKSGGSNALDNMGPECAHCNYSHN